MAEEQKHSKNGFSRYLSYFRGILSRKDQHAFEKQMMQDSFEEEAFEGMSAIKPDDLEADIIDLHHRISSRTKEKKNRIISLLRYAAVIAILLAVGGMAILLKKSVFEKSILSEQTALIDSSEIIPAVVPKETDSLKPQIAENRKRMIKETPPQTAKKTRVQTSGASNKVIVQSDITTANEAMDESQSEEMAFVAEEEVSDVAAIKISERDDAASAMKVSSEEFKSKSSDANSVPKEKNTISIRGRVLDSGTEEPLPGVNVVIKGTNKGIITDNDGNFNIEVPSGKKESLEFAFIGYVTEEVEIKNDNNITVTLTEDLVALDEVVITGYGTRKKSQLTGAVAVVNSDQEKKDEVSQIVIPKPTCGTIEYKEYINQNIRYKNLPAFDKIQIVKLGFTVSSTGEISNIRVIKSPGKSFETEAIRLLKDGPEWEPGTTDGKPSSHDITLRIKFIPPN